LLLSLSVFVPLLIIAFLIRCIASFALALSVSVAVSVSALTAVLTPVVGPASLSVSRPAVVCLSTSLAPLLGRSVATFRSFLIVSGATFRVGEHLPRLADFHELLAGVRIVAAIRVVFLDEFSICTLDFRLGCACTHTESLVGGVAHRRLLAPSLRGRSQAWVRHPAGAKRY
jgi:hypothetical protein